MALYSTESFTTEETIFVGTNGLRSPISRTLDPSKVTADAGYKHIKAGTFYGDVSGKVRPLPRTHTTALATASSTTVLAVDRAQVFVPGDVLYAIPPMAQIDLTGAWAAADTITITIGGVAVTHTATVGTLPELAAEIAVTLNSNPGLSQMVAAIATGAALWIYSENFLTPYSITESVVTVGSGDAAVSGALAILTPYQLIGTITTNGVNVTTNQLTLVAAAAIDLPVDLPIGAVSTPLGMSASDIDLTAGSTQADEVIGLYVAGNLRNRTILPYWDGELDRIFEFHFAA